MQDATRATRACSSSVAMLRPQNIPSKKSKRDSGACPEIKRHDTYANAVRCVVIVWSGEDGSNDQESNGSTAGRVVVRAGGGG